MTAGHGARPGDESAQARLVRISTAGAEAIITLDSPHNANALSTTLLTQLQAALEMATRDAAVRVVVLTGA